MKTFLITFVVWALVVPAVSVLGNRLQGKAAYGIIPLFMVVLWTAICILFAIFD